MSWLCSDRKHWRSMNVQQVHPDHYIYEGLPLQSTLFSSTFHLIIPCVDIPETLDGASALELCCNRSRVHRPHLTSAHNRSHARSASHASYNASIYDALPLCLTPQFQLWILQYRPNLCRHHRPLRWLILRLEVITDLLHGHPLDSLLSVDVLNQPSNSQPESTETECALLPFQHQQAMRMTGDIGMNRHWEDKLVLFAVVIIELVEPQFFYILWIHPAVGVGRLLDEHHGSKVFTQNSQNSVSPTVISLERDAYGRSSKYQEAGISTKPVIGPCLRGSIQWSGCFA